MNLRVVEVGDTGQYISLYRGFLVVTRGKEERGRVPLDDIAVLLVSGFGNSISTNVINELVDRNVPVIFCGDTQHPSGMVWPVDSHHIQNQRLQLQIECSVPLKKRLWQAVTRQKILAQSHTLLFFGEKDEGLRALSGRVLSGDPDNLEAQAARRYWPALLGPGFHRDRSCGGANALLNYGYAILRGATARAVASSGLHPTLGIHHQNQANPFCLVDDMMEPFRPVVDAVVKQLVMDGHTEVVPHTKRILAMLLTVDFQTIQGITPLATALVYMAQSLVRSMEQKKPVLEFPLTPMPLLWEKEGAVSAPH